MPTSDDAYRVLTISSSEPLRAVIRTALSEDPAYLLIDRRLKAGELMESIENLQPHCIVLDYAGTPTKPLELIDNLAWQFPDTAIVVALPSDQMAEASRVTLAGARAFLAQPLEQQELLDALARMKELHQRGQRAKAAQGTGGVATSSRGTFVVFSPKGGVGCSLVAINLALAMKEQMEEDVLLMDAKLLFGDLDVMLNLKAQNSIGDLVPHLGSLDEGLIRDVVSEHVSGLKVLAAPPSPLAAQGIHPEGIHRILASVQGIYANIVIDAGNFLNENTVAVMDASHKVLVVMNPDIASLRGVSRFLELCRTTLSFPGDRILLVLNEHDKREGLSDSDIERSLQTKMFAKLPWDPKAALQSINRGVPVTMHGKGGALRKAFEAMAKDLAAMAAVRQTPSPRGKRAATEAPGRSSRSA